MWRRLVCFLVLSFGFTLAHAEATDAPAARLADLAWLAGHWRGTLANGATIEAHYTGPDGGAIVSASKEVRNGRAVAFELELFFEKDGRVIYRPFPNGRRSEHDFPLVRFEATADGARAVFENTAHDFPQTFEFAYPAPDRLTITLSGPGKDGSGRSIQFDLRRVR